MTWANNFQIVYLSVKLIQPYSTLVIAYSFLSKAKDVSWIIILLTLSEKSAKS